MRTKEHNHTISIMVVDAIEFSSREADFLRKMAKHCIATNMRGCIACEKLIEVMDRALVPVRGDEPTYGLFEGPEATPRWIKP